jgi:hypothetical protein
MKHRCFSTFSLVRSFLSNATPLLLPFSSGRSIFGQCSPSAFTIFLWSDHFRAMQLLCFYHFPLVGPFSGNAAHLLLPFSSGPSIFGQCSTSAFTVFLWSVHFLVMQYLCFYHFPLVDPFSGNAALCKLLVWGLSYKKNQHSLLVLPLLTKPFSCMLLHIGSMHQHIFGNGHGHVSCIRCRKLHKYLRRGRKFG